LLSSVNFIYLQIYIIAACNNPELKCNVVPGFRLSLNQKCRS
jgi:hypothetical protein